MYGIPNMRHLDLMAKEGIEFRPNSKIGEIMDAFLEEMDAVGWQQARRFLGV